MSKATSRDLTIAGRKVRWLREQAGMGLRELAGKSGVSAAMISRFERADGDATISTVDKLRQALNLSWDELMEPANCDHDFVCRFCGQPASEEVRDGA